MREAAEYGFWLAPLFLGLFIALAVLLPSWKYVAGAVVALGTWLCILWITLVEFQPAGWNPIMTKLALTLVTSGYCAAVVLFAFGYLALRFR